MFLGRGDILYKIEVKKVILISTEVPSGQNFWLSLKYTRMSMIRFHDSALKAILFACF